ncbi:MAG: M23 family metallopeptidase [Actinobacteria bacterium]|nr:M23 family metallopeptidase [Actinomycetota bacterium]
MIPALLLLLTIGTGGQWPVADPTLLSVFRPPSSVWGAGHRGVDLAARTGQEVRAMAAGVVSFAGTIAGKPVVAIALPGPGSRRVTYEPVVATVAVGQAVRAGDVIGTLAAAGGHCGGAVGCVHIGLRTADGYLDPLSLMGRRPAVLKP